MTSLPTHNHGPDEGIGTSCFEYRLDGRLYGTCVIREALEQLRERSERPENQIDPNWNVDNELRKATARPPETAGAPTLTEKDAEVIAAMAVQADRQFGRDSLKMNAEEAHEYFRKLTDRLTATTDTRVYLASQLTNESPAARAVAAEALRLIQTVTPTAGRADASLDSWLADEPHLMELEKEIEGEIRAVAGGHVEGDEKDVAIDNIQELIAEFANKYAEREVRAEAYELAKGMLARASGVDTTRRQRPNHLNKETE